MKLHFQNLFFTKKNRQSLKATFLNFIMRIKIIILTILSSLLFTIIIYNIDFEERTCRYFFISLFYCLFYIFLNYKFQIKNKKLLIIVVVFTPILVDSSVLLSYPQMVPLRFPYSSLFPILGCSLAYLYIDKKKILGLLLSIFLIIFFYISHLFIVPYFEYLSTKGMINKNLYKDLLEYKFYNNQNDKISIRELIKDSKCVLVECYFVGCKPCEEKDKILDTLLKNFKYESFKIIKICNGKVSSFQSFKNSIVYNNSLSHFYLYDRDSILSNKLNIYSYPNEIILKNEKIISVEEGFNRKIGSIYLKNKIIQINKLLNEK